MKLTLIYTFIFVLLLIAELVYFRVAKRFRIVDKPNARSSHTKVVLRGGGIVFVFGAWLWSMFFHFPYPWFLIGFTLIAVVSFIDDIWGLPAWIRLIAQFVAMALVFYQLGILYMELWWVVALMLIVYVGASNVINFMDGINGMLGVYALVALVPLSLITPGLADNGIGLDRLAEQKLVISTILADIVYCIFNFREKGKAKCFAGDVGSVGIAFILLFLIGNVVLKTADPTYLIFLVVFGVDGCLTIIHRMMLHEDLSEAHRKHAYQLMANELKMSHVVVTTIYAAVQLGISLAYLYIIPNTVLAHWIYLVCVVCVLSVAYVLFMKKNYHLHEEYLKSINA